MFQEIAQIQKEKKLRELPKRTTERTTKKKRWKKKKKNVLA